MSITTEHVSRATNSLSDPGLLLLTVSWIPNIIMICLSMMLLNWVVDPSTMLHSVTLIREELSMVRNVASHTLLFFNESVS